MQLFSIGFNAPPLVHRLGAVPQDTLRHRIPHNPAQGTLQGLKHDVNGQTRNALQVVRYRLHDGIDPRGLTLLVVSRGSSIHTGTAFYSDMHPLFGSP